MPDPRDDFAHGLPGVTPLPPAEVRRRGDRRRRTSRLTVAGGVLAVAVAVGAPVLAVRGGPDRAVEPAPPAPPPAVTTIPAGFALGGDGWEAFHGADALTVCGTPAWSPTEPRPGTDELGARLSGGESDVERTLTAYAGPADARAAVAAIRAAVDACQAQSAALAPDPVDTPDGFAFLDRLGGDQGYVVVVARVGNALLLERTYAQGLTGTQADEVVGGAVDDTAPVVARMCVFAATGC